MTEEPSFVGWHSHALQGATGQDVESICVGPSNDAKLDTLTTVVHDLTKNIRQIQVMMKMFDEDDPITQNFHLDNAVMVAGAKITTVNNVAGLKLYGLHHMASTTCSVVIAGIDCGNNFAVAADGTTFVPWQSDPDRLITQTYLEAVWAAEQVRVPDGASYFGPGPSPYYGGYISAFTDGSTNWIVPIIAGYAYASRGQILRPATQQESGALNGPAFAKIRRTHQMGALLANAVNGSLKFGTDFTTMRAATLTTGGGTQFSRDRLYTGTYWSTLENGYDFDSMLAWEITSPVPATILALGGFLHTQDR